MDKKGLFYGKNDNVSGVKVLGFEMPWGNIWKSILGWINASGTQKVKMTHGPEDGSTAAGYNTTGADYVTIDGATPSGTNGGYISVYTAGDFGLIPITASGSATTYLCDSLWFNNSQTDFALVGGDSNDGAPCGAFCSGLSGAAGRAPWNFGAALSYKPLAATATVG